MSWLLLMIPTALLGLLAGEVEFRWVRRRLRRHPDRWRSRVELRCTENGFQLFSVDVEQLRHLARFAGDARAELVTVGTDRGDTLRLEVVEVWRRAPDCTESANCQVW